MQAKLEKKTKKELIAIMEKMVLVIKNKQKKPKAKKETIPLDMFGSRVGTIASKINDQILLGERVVEGIARNLGIHYRIVHGHLSQLAKKGYIARSGKGEFDLLIDIEEEAAEEAITNVA